jgi:hypothetical protein
MVSIHLIEDWELDKIDTDLNRNNNYIETENPYEDLRQLDLNFANDDIGS